MVFEALTFVRTNGIGLESAVGPVPTLAPAIARGPIGGSWWAHPQDREVFALTRAIRGCPDILLCQIVGGKVTYAHRRLWPALVRLADNFPKKPSR